MKKILYALLIVFGAAGCAVRISHPVAIANRVSGYLEFEGTAEYAGYDVRLGEKIQTTGVHPDDSGFLFGDTTTDVRTGIDFPIRLGLRWLTGTPETKLVLGSDIRFNTFTNMGAYETGIYDFAQQSSDRRPTESGSFVFSHLRMPAITPIFSVGVRQQLGRCGLEVAYGLPYSSMRAESGHDRFGRWQVMQSETWSGWGQWLFGRMVWRIDKEDEIDFGISVFAEEYQGVEFLGEPAKIKSVGGTIFFRL